MGRIIQYFKFSHQELKKVSWPTRKEMVRFLFTIIISISLATGLIMLIDYVLSRLVKITLFK